MSATIDFNTLQKAYFQWDMPVPYKLNEKDILYIYPVSMKDSEVFLASVDVISIDKDSLPDAKIISMSYLDFVVNYLMTEQIYCDKFVNIMRLCLHLDNVFVGTDSNGFHWLECDNGIKIKGKQFNDIRRIILYQNIIGYDDEYINPELKRAMEETDELKHRGIEYPNAERRMAIITAHSGLPKKEQMEMSFRENTMVFKEVGGEVDFLSTYPIALYGGNADKIEHWIYHKKKTKFDGYITERGDFVSKIGANPNNVKQVENSDGIEAMFNDFKK